MGRVRFRSYAAAAIALALVGGATFVGYAQVGLIDIYQQAADAYRSAAAASPMNAPCYLALAAAENCKAGSLMGGPANCAASPCPLVSLGRSAGVPGIAGVPGFAPGAAGSSGSGGGVLNAILSHQQEIMQGVAVAHSVFKMFSAFRKKRQEQRMAEASRVDAAAQLEAARMQEMGRMLAQQRAEVERVADLLLATAQNTLDSADSLLAQADALLGQSVIQGTSAAPQSTTTAPAAPAGLPGDRASAGSSSGRSQMLSKDATHGAPSPSAGCPGAWTSDAYVVTAYGNDDLWLESGALAFLTDGSGKATPSGTYLSVEYTTARRTSLSFFLADGRANDLAPGESRRVAVRPTNGSVAVQVRYCRGGQEHAAPPERSW